MEIQTKPYGKIEINERQLVEFPRGLFGFEEYKSFALLDASQKPFYWLQSLEEINLAFVLIDPLVFRPDFELKTESTELEEIGLTNESREERLVFAIVTIPEEQSRMSANLQGPIVINTESHKARQVISLDPAWKTKHFIFEEMVGSRAC